MSQCHGDEDGGGGGGTLQQHSGEECRRGEAGRKKEARPQLTEWMLRGSGGRGGEGRHVTKCILITEQQMPRMELLCCLNSRTLHFSGLTSHRIHLPASCQFRVERVKKAGERKRERERREGGSLTPIRPSLSASCGEAAIPFTLPPVACTISDLHNHPHLHALGTEAEAPLSFGCCTISRRRLG